VGKDMGERKHVSIVEIFNKMSCYTTNVRFSCEFTKWCFNFYILVALGYA